MLLVCYSYVLVCADGEDISDVMNTVSQYLWFAKAIKTKVMTENLRTSNDCRFTYMLDFILRPGGNLEYRIMLHS